MTYYKKKYNYNKKNYINSLNYGKRNISLPVHSNLKLSEVDKICNMIKKNI
jgi:dTDP-4-amino-4,6-dideoxygalactose transaminase